MRDPLSFDLYLFDVGNVVVKDITTLEATAAHYGFDLDALSFDYEHYAFPLMDGTIDSSCYWDHVHHQFGIKVDGDPLATFFHPSWNEPVRQLIEKLRLLGKRVACGSNTYEPHWVHLQSHGFLSLFDAQYASHEMGISKPATQFFTTILEAEQLRPDQVFFVDDSIENVQAAHNLGITAIAYAFDDVLDRYFSSVCMPSEP
mgnify:CR=1 FL=1